MLTTIPLLAFAFMSPLVSRLARHYGLEHVVFAALICLFFGIVCRSLPSTGTLFTGILLIGLAIAVCNVLIPSLVKRDLVQKLV